MKHDYTNELELKSLLIRIKNTRKKDGTEKTSKTNVRTDLETIKKNKRINKYIKWYTNILSKKFKNFKKAKDVQQHLKEKIIKLSEDCLVDKFSYEKFGTIIIKMVNHIMTKGQFRGYSYQDDFVSDSVFKILKYLDNFDGTSCNFSYLSPNIIGGSFSENFGIVGKGKIVLLKYDNINLKPFKEMYFEKGITCFKFNRINDNIIHVGDVEGKLITINYNNQIKEEIFSNKIYQAEITSLNIGKISNNLLLSTSLDNSSKIIDLNNNKIVLNIQNYSKKGFTSNSIDYKTPNIISLSTNDGTVLLFDIKNCVKPIKCLISNNPILSMDFNPFNATFAVGESNGIINIYDLRNDKNIPISTLTGHQLAVKEIKFSPFQQNLLCSCGFDMNINLWDVQYSLPIKCYKHHTEFVTGIDFSNYNQNIISSISFDKTLDIFSI